MLSDVTPTPCLAVSDLGRARAFYEGTLGFPEPQLEFDGAITYAAGAGRLMVYVSQYAGTNKATAAGFHLSPEEFDSEVARLRQAGVELQTFDMPGMTWEDGVAVGDGGRAVWFADPDGNILNLDAATESG